MALLFAAAPAHARQQPQPAAKPPAAQRIRDGVYRIGTIEVDTVKKQARVFATLNGDVTTVEWIANVKGGAKAYESAFTVDTDAATFNAALLLMGLDPAHARVPVRHFDPIPPQGDVVELWVEWILGGVTRRLRIEEFLFDERTMATMPVGPWVYTGSSFINGKYMADLDGVLIGFVHSPSPVIENPGPGAVNAFGKVTLNNRRLGLPAGLPVTLVIRVAGPGSKSSR